MEKRDREGKLRGMNWKTRIAKFRGKKKKIGRRLCFVLVSDGDGGDEDNDDDKVIYDGNFGY